MADLYYLPDRRSLQVTAGETLLEAALTAGIPHTHACGGRSRCSTCRVRILAGLESISERTPAEKELAVRLRFDPATRLACQVRTSGDVTVRRLVLDPEDLQLTDQRRAHAGPVGEERDIAVLFADIRQFTPLAEALPPYDVIHLLNRFFVEAEQAVEGNGGEITSYMGDGFMALFLAEPPREAALAAVRTGVALGAVAASVADYVHQVHACDFSVGVGVHLGSAVVGAVGRGHGERAVTAIGDVVNTASRVEAATRAAGVPFLITADTYREVAPLIHGDEMAPVTLKGKRGRHVLYAVVGLREPDEEP